MPGFSLNINVSSVANPQNRFVNETAALDSADSLYRPKTTTAFSAAMLDMAAPNEQLNNSTSNHDTSANNSRDPLGLFTTTPYSAYANSSIVPSNQHFYDLGPPRDSLQIVIPVTIIYSLIFISGVIGNISTCIVIKKNRSMHTATNYYLFSLAISDFLLLLSGVPQEMYFIWSKYPYVFGEFFCIGRGVLAETSANATVLTITAFTVERYVAICHPFLGQAMSKLSRAIRIIVLIWLVSVVTAIPQAAQFGIITWHGFEKCAVVRDIIQHSFQLSTFIFFFAPMSIILVLYLLIGLRLYRSNLIGGDMGGGGSVLGTMEDINAAAARGSSGRLGFGSSNFVRPSSGRKNSTRLGMKGTQSDTMLYRYAGGNQLSAVRGRINQYGTRRVLKMLVAVVICFFLCWAPFHAQRLIAVYGTHVIGGGDGGGSGGGIDDSPSFSDLNLSQGEQQSRDNATASDKHHLKIVYTVMTYVSGVLYYLSTCINPLLYNLMSNKFRQAFKAILFRKKSTTGSINSRRAQQSQRLRRNPTLTSSTQRESTESELQSKHTMLQAVLNERKVTNHLLP